MVQARSLLSNNTGRVAIVYKKIGDDKLIGFTTDEHFYYTPDNIFPPISKSQYQI